jgi:gamma-glutamyl hydrolase
MSNNNLVIGIITIPYDISSSYISSGHYELLNYYKLKIYPIPFNTTDYKYYFERINGLYIPSGIVSKGKIETYYDNNDTQVLINTCKEFIKLGIQSYNNNIPFPIWGTCLGMELMIQAIDTNINLSKIYAYPNYMLPFNPTKEGMLYSKIIQNMNEDILKCWMTKPIQIHNHGKGVTPILFKKSNNLMNIFNIITINEDKNNRKFISLIEGKKYPFYGVQWHPELSKKTFIIFETFIKDLIKSKKKIKQDYKIIKSSIDTKICPIYSDGLYKKCIFFKK